MGKRERKLKNSLLNYRNKKRHTLEKHHEKHVEIPRLAHTSPAFLKAKPNYNGKWSFFTFLSSPSPCFIMLAILFRLFPFYFIFLLYKIDSKGIYHTKIPNQRKRNGIWLRNFFEISRFPLV